MASCSELPNFLSNDPLINPRITEALGNEKYRQESQAMESLMTTELLKNAEPLRDTEAYQSLEPRATVSHSPVSTPAASEKIKSAQDADVTLLPAVFHDGPQSGLTSDAQLSTRPSKHREDNNSVSCGLQSSSQPSSPVLCSAATKLKRSLNETDELIVCPGVHDGFSARIALSVGFTALYMVSTDSLSSTYILTLCRLELVLPPLA